MITKEEEKAGILSPQIGENIGDFQRTALEAGGHRARAEDCLPVGRSTIETPDGSPSPAWQKKGPFSWSGLNRTGLHCYSENKRIKSMVYTLSGKPLPHLPTGPFPYLDPRRQLVRLIPPSKRVKDFYMGN